MKKISRPKPMSHKTGYGKGSPYRKGGKVGKQSKT